MCTYINKHSNYYKSTHVPNRWNVFLSFNVFGLLSSFEKNEENCNMN